MIKNLLCLLSISTIVLLSSCGSDDTEDIINEILFDGETLVGENGIVVDLGDSEDHYEVTFAISDGDINYISSSGSFQFSTSADFYLLFGAASLGTDQFNTGTFQFRTVVDAVPDDNFFFSGSFKEGGSPAINVTEGTITISGSSPNYTLQFDLTLTGDKKLTGAFVGTFELE